MRLRFKPGQEKPSEFCSAYKEDLQGLEGRWAGAKPDALQLYYEPEFFW